MTIRDKIVETVLAERKRQDKLKLIGKFKYTCADVEMLNSERLLVLVEEVGEVARAILNQGGLSNDKRHYELKTELIQCAAVCIAWLEGINKPDIW